VVLVRGAVAAGEVEGAVGVARVQYVHPREGPAGLPADPPRLTSGPDLQSNCNFQCKSGEAREGGWRKKMQNSRGLVDKLHKSIVWSE
jgi:hypothetical protein